MNRRLAPLLVPLGFWLWLMPLPASAATSCSASMSALSFGVVNPFSGTVSATATLNYSCTSTTVLGVIGAKVNMCFSIGSGAQGTGALAPRQMLSGSSVMSFNIYKDAAYSQIWGTLSDGTYGPMSATLAVPLGLLSSTATGSLSVYGRIPSPQTALVPGSYSNIFSGGNTEFSYRYNNDLLGTASYPASCSSGGNDGGSSSFPFTASASVLPMCNPVFTVNDVDFGSHGSLVASIDTSATMAPQCTNTTPYQIGLDNGINASGSSRRMKSGSGAYVGYELYRDNGRTQRWGSTLNVDTLSAAGNGSPQTVTIYGRVAPQTTPAAGGYSDTVTVTVTY